MVYWHNQYRALHGVPNVTWNATLAQYAFTGFASVLDADLLGRILSAGADSLAWGSKNGEALLYTWEALQPGNTVEGCAILEGASSTFFVPENWTLTMDRFGNARVTGR